MLPASRARQQAPHALLAALALAAIAATPARAANVEVGVLTCKVAGGVGFVFGSTKAGGWDRRIWLKSPSIR